MRILSKPPVQVPALTLSANPYVDNEIWNDGVELFHAWAASRFNIGTVYGDFALAQAMDVHRIISDVWLVSMISLGLAQTHVIKLGYEGPEIPAFSLLTPKLSGKVELRCGDLQAYDPWTDRELDIELPDACYADHYIDKYFDVFTNEYFAIHKKPRKRPNGKTFFPIELKDHPRYANTAKTRHAGPAPEEWRNKIERILSGEEEAV